MNNLVNISNTIQYEEFFKKIIDSFLSGSDREKYQFNLKYKNILYIFKRDDFVIDYDKHIWIIFNPLFDNEINLLNSNIIFFRYKKLVYGFFKDIKNNVILTCKEEERFINEN